MSFIFQFTMDQVLDRSKTVTRRLMKLGDRLGMHKGAVAVIQDNGFPRWIVGKSYTIHRRRGFKREPGVRALVVALRDDPSPLEISAAEARLEGYADPAGFLKSWNQNIHRGRPTAGDPCWRIEFILVNDAPAVKPAQKGTAA